VASRLVLRMSLKEAAQFATTAFVQSYLSDESEGSSRTDSNVEEIKDLKEKRLKVKKCRLRQLRMVEQQMREADQLSENMLATARSLRETKLEQVDTPQGLPSSSYVIGGLTVAVGAATLIGSLKASIPEASAAVVPPIVTRPVVPTTQRSIIDMFQAPTLPSFLSHKETVGPTYETLTSATQGSPASTLSTSPVMESTPKKMGSSWSSWCHCSWRNVMFNLSFTETKK